LPAASTEYSSFCRYSPKKLRSVLSSSTSSILLAILDLEYGQPECEAGPAARCIRRDDIAALRNEQAPRNIQAQAVTVNQAVVGGVDAFELVKHGLQHVGRHTRPMVTHPHFQPAAGRLRLHAYFPLE